MLIEATSQTTLGPVYTLTGTDDLFVGADVTIRCTYNDPVNHTGADAVISWEGTHSITVAGTIIGEDEAINLVGCLTAQTVTIQATGVLISGGDGMVQDADGVILDGLGSHLRNAGTITAYGSAVSVIAPEGGVTSIVNLGSMTGRVSGIWHKFGNGTLSFTNSGTVSSDAFSYLGNSGVDRLTNSGTLNGDIALGGGDDLFVGSTGTVNGLIDGGDGDDTFRPGSHAEIMDGGDGIDLLDFTAATTAVTLNLTTPAQNSGAQVAGDSYTGFENVLGGGFSDRLTGDAGANRLEGAGRLDTLAGGAGDDTLIGGRGDDRCYGGQGADTFLFQNLKHLGDRIYDFTSASDVIAFEGEQFGFGSFAGALDETAFVAGHAALDADDRLLFDAATHLLWFDADGSGASAAVVVASLQSGATLTAADILIL
ncbi:calcium-binding protein [Tabrizicola oligotrophica]|uniref:Calcium-binding protein n=1 Tax=Tabrizicola oligotrophica TaxID=2710650 RepID=A0A6M0QRI7_9RHOB|nr:calcium-binding protein [Tabrizicola oligotrophica]NEY89404.1 calcium-binding protein [Tabrizicola oligotrophica]